MAQSRRTFLCRTGYALGATALASSLEQLGMISALAQQPNAVAQDYKALVCIFLFGGNDGNNLIVPTDETYNANYATPRGPLALPLPDPQNPNALLPLNSVQADGHTYGLNPRMPQLAALYNAG